jgi:hypothetical protein
VLEACRTGAAFSLTFLVSLMVPILSAWQVLLLPLCLLFAGHLAHCVVRAVSEITINEDGIVLARGFLPSQHLLWADVSSLELRVFPLGRYRRAFMSDLKLRSPTAVMLIDDGVEHFSGILGRAWTEARRRGVSISEATRANLVGLGHADAAGH